MIPTEILDFRTSRSERGYVARFDLKIGTFAWLRNLSLIRPDQAPDEAWVYFPHMVGGSPAYVLSPTMRKRVAGQAAEEYFRETGVRLVAAQPPSKAANDDMTAVRRIVGAEVEETCRMAGI